MKLSREEVFAVVAGFICLFIWCGIAVDDARKLEDQVSTLEEQLSAQTDAFYTQTKQLHELDDAYKQLSTQEKKASEELQKTRKNNQKLTKELKSVTKENQARATRITELRQQIRKQVYERRTTAVSKVGSPKVIGRQFETTWYNDYNYTASGRFVTPGVSISVDPTVIPLGTWVELEFPDGRRMVRRADDTGRAVKGHIIDIYDNQPDGVLLTRGRTHGVKVSIVNRKDG